MFVPLTPLDFKRRAVQFFGNKIGVVDGDRRYSYREFGERTNRLANSLLQAGLRRFDRVAYLAYNSYPLLEGYFGVLRAGGVLVPINIRLARDEIVYVLNHCEARFLLIDVDFAPALAAIESQLKAPPQTIWLTDVPEGRSEPLYDDFITSASSDEPPFLHIDENDVAEIFYTSGTTGFPKGVMLSHRNLYLHAMSVLTAVPHDDSDVQLHTIPLFHVNGWGTPQYLTAVGGTHVMLRKFDPEQVLRLVEKEGVTRFSVVPAMLTAVLNHPLLSTANLSSLRLVIVGGAPAPEEMIRQAEEALGCTVICGYGLSETSPLLAGATCKQYLAAKGDDERYRRQASTGMPSIGVDVRVIGANNLDVPWNGRDVGEIAARSNNVMVGYWNDPQGTDEVIRDGWFYTGDMAVIDEEGYLLIVDRRKDIIISGGENISSVDIEKVLYEHPAILENAVIGVPDDQWGEVPKALVTLRPNMTATEEDILRFCRVRLAGFKVPKSVDFLTELPKGGTGKILKRELRLPYWQNQERKVH